jgi:hypothetical protein
MTVTSRETPSVSASNFSILASMTVYGSAPTTFDRFAASSAVLAGVARTAAGHGSPGGSVRWLAGWGKIFGSFQVVLDGLALEAPGECWPPRSKPGQTFRVVQQHHR